MWKTIIPIVCGLLTSFLILHTLSETQTTDQPTLTGEKTDTFSAEYPANKLDVLGFKSYWGSVLKNTSAKNAYAELKEHYKDLDSGEKHEVAHYFGGLLYQSVGLEGISVCDDDFSYGCFHEFITFAILDHGPSVLTELNDFCTHSEYDCQHGVGHGIQADFGYEEQNLLDALAVCNNLGSVDESDGCFGGIFMEYNLRTIWGKDAPIRLFDIEAGDDTCYIVPTYAQKACFFWSAQWHMALSQGLDRVSQIAKTQTQCSTFKTIPQQLQCVNGLGYEISSYELDPEKAIYLCDINRDQEDVLHHQQCVISTLAGLNGSPLNRTAVRETCYKQDVLPADTCTTVLDSQDRKRIDIITNY